MIDPGIRYQQLVQTENDVHHLAECGFYSGEFHSIDSPSHKHFLLVISLKGKSHWKCKTHELLMLPKQVVILPACASLLVKKKGVEPATALLWHFKMESMIAIDNTLGNGIQEKCASFQCPLWSPRALSPAQDSLVLSLRSQPETPLLNLWYSAKFLELISSLPPASHDKNAFSHSLHPAIRECLSILHSEFTEPLSLSEIAARSGISPTHLSHLFTKEMGTTISLYIQRLRLQKASLLLRSGSCNVTEAAFEVGYSSLGQFSRTFKQTFGHSPGKHRSLHE